MVRLRLFIVALLLIAAYTAQAVFDHGALQPLVPMWLLERVQWLFEMTLWLPEDLFTAASWVLALACLLIGLLLPAWSSPSPTDRVPLRTDDAVASGTRGNWLPAAAGSVVAAGVGLALAAGVAEQPWLAVIWLGAMASVAYGAWRSRARAGQHRPAGAGNAEAPVATGWLPLGIVLLLTALLAGWHWTALPVRIDTVTARFGIQMTTGGAVPLFAAGPTGSLGLAFLPGRVLLWLLRDSLTTSHALGMIAALVTVTGTWLVGRELFRRPPLERDGHLVVDDGRRAALLAAGLAGVSLATMHFGRLAPFLPATAVGVLAFWQLLRCVRTSDPRSALAAGLLAGSSLLVDRSGLVFLIGALLWWSGFALVGAAGASGRHRLLLRQFGWWAAGVAVILAPVVGNWLHAPETLRTYLTAVELYGLGALPAINILDNLAATVRGLFWVGDASPVFGISTHLLATIIAPLFLAGLATLLFSLDQLAGWCLLTWSATALVASAAINGAAPDWPTLLPLVPAAGLVVALLADRLRLLIVESFGAWTALASFYVAAGLLIAVAAANWIVYWETTQLDGDAVSYLAHGLRASDQAATLVQVASDERALIATADVVLRFAAARNAARLSNVTVAAMERTGAATRYFVLPPDRAALDAVRARYPQGSLSLERDLHGNPRLWVYDVP